MSQISLRIRQGLRRRLSPAHALSAIVLAMVLAPATVFAAPSVEWNSPANNSSFLVGTDVSPTGQAASVGAGAGLDLVLVLDRSGSMCCQNFSGQSRQQWQRDAAIALVNSLPTTGVSISIVEYGSVANTSVRLGLTDTNSAANIQSIIGAINAVPASGLTAMGTGIDLATSVLTDLSGNATPGRSKQMVVISDGIPNRGTPVPTAVANALNAGVNALHGIAIPGGNTNVLQNQIAIEGGGAFADFSNPDDLANIESFFSAGGGFVGLDQLDLQLPNGTLLEDYPVDAFGNFVVDPAWAMELGANIFTATASFADGTQLSRELSLIGVMEQNGGSGPGDDPVAVPTPSSMPLLIAGLGLLGLLRRRSAG